MINMENKAQVSFEFLIMIALMIIIAALTTVLSSHYLTSASSIKQTTNSYSNKALNMLR